MSPHWCRQTPAHRSTRPARGTPPRWWGCVWPPRSLWGTKHRLRLQSTGSTFWLKNSHCEKLHITWSFKFSLKLKCMLSFHPCIWFSAIVNVNKNLQWKRQTLWGNHFGFSLLLIKLTFFFFYNLFHPDVHHRTEEKMLPLHCDFWMKLQSWLCKNIISGPYDWKKKKFLYTYIFSL